MLEIRNYEDGTIIEQGRGKFDDYCVFLTRPEQDTYAPKDTEYFSFFIENEVFDMIEIDIALEEHGLPCFIE